MSAKHANRREPSARRGWLSSFLADDLGNSAPADRRRLLLALAIAVALHEIIAGIFPWRQETIPKAPVETITIARLTRIEHRARPTPKPRLTPRPVVHAKVIAHTHVKPRVVNPGRPSQRHKVRRIASARPMVRTRHHRRADVQVPVGGNGAGTGATTQAGAGGPGSSGTGTGESGAGAGTGGAPAAHEPCGYVDFEPTQDARVDQATGRVWEYVTIAVHFPDGTTQSFPLDYPFYYPTEAQDPFLKGHDNIPATFQFPPAEQRANEPALVQYVMQHTTADGYTLLRECPKGP